MRSATAWTDTDLIVGLRGGCGQAQAEFTTRFRSMLEAYAHRVRMPRGDWAASITDVLTDEVIRFANPSVTVPTNLSAHLIHVLRNRYLNVLRAADRRERHHAEAADDLMGERVVTSLCSEDAIRACAGPEPVTPPTRAVLGRLAEELRSGITEEEYSILMWISQGESHVEIAKWLGSSYASTRKRIWRLCQRLRAQATNRAATYSAKEQSDFERFLQRAGNTTDKRRTNASA